MARVCSIPAIARGRRWGQDLDEQVRDPLKVLFSDEGHMLRRDEDQVRNDHLRRFLGEDHVYGGGEHLPEGVE